MEVIAKLNQYRKSAKKVREIVPLIKGFDVATAKQQLQNSGKGCAADVLGLLESAIANAGNNYNLDKESLFVKSILVEEGPVMKRWMARAHGRAARILKRTCSILLTIEEIEKEEKVEKKEEKKGKVVKETKKEKKDISKKEEEKKETSEKKTESQAK